METERESLSLSKAIGFVRAIRDYDCFTIFWELVEYSPEPVSFETMRRTFGARPAYLLEVLGHLHRLGIARKAGRQWTVTGWAKSNLEYLETVMKDFQVEVAQPVTPSTEVFANDASEVATLNGFWVASASLVTAPDRVVSGRSSTASPDESAKLDSPDLADKPQNETRSHDYK
jgi:hypothetical protein